MLKYFYTIFFCLGITVSFAQIQSDNWQSSPSILGYSGNIIIPSAYLGADKTLNVGYTHLPVENAFQPYGDERNLDARLLFANLSFLPFMEVTFGINKPYGVKDEGIGDRTIFTRFQLMKERKHLPAILLGLHDTFTKSSFNHTNYLVLSKKIQAAKDWTLYTHLGYGFKIIDTTDNYLLGVFGGVNLRWKYFGASIEYDADQLNAGIEANIRNRVYLKASLLDMQYFSTSINIRFSL